MGRCCRWFANGALYFDVEDEDFSGSDPTDPSGSLPHFNIYSIREAAPVVKLVAKDVGAFIKPKWMSLLSKSTTSVEELYMPIT